MYQFDDEDELTGTDCCGFNYRPIPDFKEDDISESDSDEDETGTETVLNMHDDDDLIFRDFQSNDVSNPDFDLFEAARQGDVKRLKELMDEGADINVEDAEGYTPLHLACRYGHPRVVISLLCEGGDSSLGEKAIISDHHVCYLLLLQSKYGATNFPWLTFTQVVADPERNRRYLQRLLYHGSKKNWMDVVDFLIQQSEVDVNCVCKEKTALIVAAEKGNVELMDKLFKHGALLDLGSKTKTSPLHVACENGHYEAVEYLLDNGASVDVVDLAKRTPLFFAASSRNLNVLKLLLARGASVNSKDERGDNALLHAYGLDGKKFDYLDVIKCLLESGSEIANYTLKNSINCMVVAAYNGHCAIVRAFLESGVDPDSPSACGDTALAKACENGHADVVEVLLKHNADPNFERTLTESLGRYEQFSWMPLHVAARRGQVSIVNMLLAHNANVNHIDLHGKSPLMYALKYFYKTMYAKNDLESNTFGLNELNEPKFKDGLLIAKSLISWGADTNQECVYSKHKPVTLPLWALLEQIAMSKTMEVMSFNFVQMFPLFFGRRVMIDQMKMVELLIASDLDFNLHRPRNSDFKSVKDYLIPEEFESLMIFLFKAGAHHGFISEASLMFLKHMQLFRARLVRSMNLFKVVVLNGFTVDEMSMVCEKKQHPHDELLGEAITWYHELMCKPLTLFQLNRIAVRKQLLQASSYRSILPLIDKLPLPTGVKLYLKFEGSQHEIVVESTN